MSLEQHTDEEMVKTPVGLNGHVKLKKSGKPVRPAEIAHHPRFLARNVATGDLGPDELAMLNEEEELAEAARVKLLTALAQRSSSFSLNGQAHTHTPVTAADAGEEFADQLADAQPKKGERQVTQDWRSHKKFVIKRPDPNAVVPEHQTDAHRERALRIEQIARARMQGGGLGEQFEGAEADGVISVEALTERYADWIAEAATATEPKRDDSQAAWEAHLDGAEKKARGNEAFWRWHGDEEVAYQWELAAEQHAIEEAAAAQQAVEDFEDGLHDTQDALSPTGLKKDDRVPTDSWRSHKQFVIKPPDTTHVPLEGGPVQFTTEKQSATDWATNNPARRTQLRKNGGLRGANAAFVAEQYATTPEQAAALDIDASFLADVEDANAAEVAGWKAYAEGPYRTEAETDAAQDAEFAAANKEWLEGMAKE